MARAFYLLFLSSMLAALAETASGQDPALQTRINQAIDRGVQALKKINWAVGQRTGGQALAGWALLESGVPADDPVVQVLTDAIRRRAVTENKTYDLALAICFLDKLGDPRDEPFIQAMGIRLLAGQTKEGGWTYVSGKAVPLEENRLAAQLARIQKQGYRAPPARTKSHKTVHYLDPFLIYRLEILFREPPQSRRSQGADNSNTQFALMGLWVARRHGVPVRQALSFAEWRFLQTQQDDGGWIYRPTMPIPNHYAMVPGNPPWNMRRRATAGSTAPMTCAGLFALAAGEGMRNHLGRRLHLSQAPPVRAALQCLGNTLLVAQSPRELCYLLLGMEKMAVVYDIKTIGGIDWYLWGARLLVDRQSPAGTWNEGFSQYAADTSFALLFLKKANITSDLTANLLGIVKEPAHKTLPEAIPKGKTDPHELDLPMAFPREETSFRRFQKQALELRK